MFFAKNFAQRKARKHLALRTLRYVRGGGESSESTDPICTPVARGATGRRSRCHVGLPTASPTRGTASWEDMTSAKGQTGTARGGRQTRLETAV